MDNGTTVLLTAPDPELEALSFALSDPESVGEWIGRLPMANVSETAGHIRQATFEIARLDTDWSTRMALLEGIRPTVAYLSNRLDRAANSAGNQADVIVRLAQRLQSNLCSGYKAVILQAYELADQDPNVRRTVSLAIHRSLSDLARTLLRTLQYYVAPAEHIWLKLNQLYLLAERLGIEDECHEDTENNSSVSLSIAGVYLRSLLLALARPYQLRHKQLSDVFQALTGWVPMVSLSAADNEDLYVVDLSSDQGPGYAGNGQDTDTSRGIHSEVLAHELEAYLREVDGSVVIPRDFDDALIHHLVDAWGEMKTRAFGRSEAAEPMKVCVGMRTAHYYLSGGAEFADLLDSTDEGRRLEINPFLSSEVQYLKSAGDRDDVWNEAFDVGGKIPENPNIDDPELRLFSPEPALPAEPEQTHQHYDTTTADTSPGGYRLRWNEPFPANLQTGEVIGLRDETDPRWCVAVVRWIRQDSTGPYMGVELLAPQARPVAVRVVQSKGGKAEFQRAFLLPELKPIGQPATLITPATPFQTGQKVHFTDSGTQSTAQLGECLLKTESFNQFTFRVLDGYLENPQGTRNMGNPEEFNNQQMGSGKGWLPQ